MPLLHDDDLVRIDLPHDGEWVDVKRQPSIGDRKRIEGAAASAARGIRAGNVNVEEVELVVDPATYDRITFTALECAIRRWSFPEPVTPENIRRLDERSFDVIRSRLDELWEGRSEAEKKL